MTLPPPLSSTWGPSTATTQPALDPLDLPLPGAGLWASISRFFRKYAVFSGRASRSEFWWVQLVLTVVLGGLNLLAQISTVQPTTTPYGTTASSGSISAVGLIASVLAIVLSLGVVVPQYALIWRRLHDANLPGPRFFISLIPFVGGLLLLALLLRSSDPQGDRFDSWR